MSKRGNGEGSISQRIMKDGKLGWWQSRLSLTGDRRKTFYRKTCKEVARKLTEATRDRDRGLPVVTDEHLSVEKLPTAWLVRMKLPSYR